MAKRPEFYRDHVNLFIALAPVVKMSRMEPLTAIVARFILDHLGMVKWLNLHTLLPYSRFNPVPYLCRIMPSTCLSVMHYLDTSDTQMLDHVLIDQYLGHYPAGSSFNCGWHFAQLFFSDRFQEFDFGWEQNFRVYGQGEPPEIDLTPIRDNGIPIALFSGNEDLLANKQDVEWIHEQIGPALVHDKVIEGGHLTLVLHKTMDFFKQDAMGLIRKYNP